MGLLCGISNYVLPDKSHRLVRKFFTTIWFLGLEKLMKTANHPRKTVKPSDITSQLSQDCVIMFPYIGKVGTCMYRWSPMCMTGKWIQCVKNTHSSLHHHEREKKQHTRQTTSPCKRHSERRGTTTYDAIVPALNWSDEDCSFTLTAQSLKTLWTLLWQKFTTGTDFQCKILRINEWPTISHNWVLCWEWNGELLLHKSVAANVWLGQKIQAVSYITTIEEGGIPSVIFKDGLTLSPTESQFNEINKILHKQSKYYREPTQMKFCWAREKWQKWY